MAWKSAGSVLKWAGWATAGLSAILVVALAGVAVAMAQGWLTPFLERQASAALGAPVRIEGGARLLLALPPGVRVDGIAVGERGEAARIQRIEGAIRLLPLLRGEVVIARFEAQAGRIDRAALAAARTGGAPQPEARAEEAQADRGSSLPRIERIAIDDIEYFDPEPGFGGPLRVRLDQVRGRIESGNQVELTADGRLLRGPGEPNGLPLPPPSPDAQANLGLARLEAGFDLPLTVRIGAGESGSIEGGLRLGDVDRLDLTLQRTGDVVRSAHLRGAGQVLGQVVGSLGFLGKPVGDWQLDARIERGASGGQAKLAFDGSFDGTKLRFNGGGDEAEPLTRFEGRFEVSGDDPADLLETLGRAPVSLPPYNVTARIRRTAGTIQIDELDGRIGDSDIAGKIDVDLTRNPPASVANLSSRILDFDDLGPLIGLPPSSTGTETLSPTQREEARLYAANPRVLPDVPFKVELWRRLNLEVIYRAEKVNAPGLPLETLAFTVRVAEGRLRVEPMQAGLAGGALNLRVDIDGTGQRPQARIEVSADRLRVEQFLAAANAGPVALGQLRARIELTGEGEGFRALASRAGGRISLSLTGGAIQQSLIELAGLDIVEFLAFSLTDDDRRIPVRCIVADLAVSQGAARTRAMLLDTPDSKITGSGGFNLGNETMNLLFQVFPRDFSVLSANMPIRVTGTLKSPVVEPAGFGAENRVLGWLLAPVDAVLAFAAPGYDDDHPCAAALGAASRAAPAPVP